MKLFWAIVIVFVACAGIVVFAQSRTNDVLQQTAAPVQQEPEPEIVEEPDRGGSSLFDPVDDDFDSEITSNAHQPEQGRHGADNDSDSEQQHEEDARELAEDLLASSEEAEEEYSYAPSWPENAQGGKDWGQSGTGEGLGNHEHQPIETGENPWAVEGDLALGDERLAAQRLQHSVVEQPDGSLLLDDTFVIRGSGTKSEPYEITWDLLMSAAETYQPRLGMEDIPERVAMLDGKHVKISGHLMFPMITGQADELLVMLNMWDGCCIGTMPSPYDAIEVQLGSPAAVGGNQQFFNYGTIEGVLQVDPYLINDWLIGLFLMDGATLHVGM